MGIRGLTRLISKYAPFAMTEKSIEAYDGKKIAIDASVSIYKFLAVVPKGALVGKDGEPTGHLSGLFYQTVKMMENNMRPVYVFDGKPPDLKSYQLDKRIKLKKEAQDKIEGSQRLKEEAHIKIEKSQKLKEEIQVWLEKSQRLKVKERTEKTQVNLENILRLEKEAEMKLGHIRKLEREAKLDILHLEMDIEKHRKKTVKVRSKQYQESAKLLRMMGIPVVHSPGEAEAQCAELARKKKVFAVVSEDMDALVFNTPVLIPHLSFSKTRSIKEYRLSKVLKGLGLDRAQFTDLCILLGCDYTRKIEGIGPKTALFIIKQHKSIQQAIGMVPKLKVVDDWNHKEVHALFSEPKVTPASEIKLSWGTPNVEQIIEFMVTEKGFSEERIRRGCERLMKSVE